MSKNGNENFINRTRKLAKGMQNLASYNEKYGTGTFMMIRESLAHNLPEPDFAQRGSEFTVALWRDWLTENVIALLKLNDRQKTAILYIKQNGSITNKQYQELSKVTDRTVLRDVKELVDKGVFHKIGTTGRATYYVIKNKPDINPTNPT